MRALARLCCGTFAKVSMRSLIARTQVESVVPLGLKLTLSIYIQLIKSMFLPLRVDAQSYSLEPYLLGLECRVARRHPDSGEKVCRPAWAALMAYGRRRHNFQHNRF